MRDLGSPDRARVKHEPVSPVEFLSGLARLKRIRIIKRFARFPKARGLWHGDEDVPGQFDETTITIAWAAHRSSDFAHDMVNTLIHEVLHQLRKAASEAWIRKQTARLYVDDKVRAEAAIRLLDVTYFGGEGDE